jgi:hypothetical protein
MKVTSKEWSQNGQREDQSLLHAGQVFRIFCTPSVDAPLIRRSKTKRHSGLLQIKNRAIETSFCAARDSPVPFKSQYRRNTYRNRNGA